MTAGRSSRLVGIAGVVALLALAGYWYGSPYLALRQIAAAAEAKDGATFNDHVDYPRLRENLKGQLSARMTAALPKADSGNVFAGIGAMIGMGLVNQVVDAMVRPQFVMAAMQHGSMPATGGQADPDPSAPSRSRIEWRIERQGVDRIVGYAIDPDPSRSPALEQAGFVFERSGFAHWRLTEVQLPDTP